MACCFGFRRARQPVVSFTLAEDDSDTAGRDHNGALICEYAARIEDLLHASMRFDCIQCHQRLAIVCRTARLPMAEEEAAWFADNVGAIQEQMRTSVTMSNDTVLRIVQLMPSHPEAMLMVLTSECGHAEAQPVSGRPKVKL